MDIINRIKNSVYYMQIEKKYREINIYVDEGNNLVIVATGKSRDWITAEIDVIYELKFPYSDIEVEDTLITALEKCYSLTPNKNLKESPLAKYLGYKRYSKAVKGKRHVFLNWSKGEGFTLTPTEKKKRQGYIHLEDEIFVLGCIENKGDLGRAFKEVLKKSKITSE